MTELLCESLSECLDVVQVGTLGSCSGGITIYTRFQVNRRESRWFKCKWNFHLDASGVAFFTWMQVNGASLGFEWKYDIHSHPSKHDQRMAFLDSFIHLVPNRVFLHCFWLVHRRDCVFLHLLTSGMCQIGLVIRQVADSCMAACCSWVVDDLYDLLSVI